MEHDLAYKCAERAYSGHSVVDKVGAWGEGERRPTAFPTPSIGDEVVLISYTFKDLVIVD
jgi:hypothetical protein